MKKSTILKILRQLRILYYVDWLRFCVQKIKIRNTNKTFKDKFPNVPLPPDYILYETFQLNYFKYYVESRETAEELRDYFANYIDLKTVRILDWGCGPGRLIRHMPEVMGDGCELYGTDYNATSIEWCISNLQGIHFNLNTLEAKLPYNDNFFDALYGISIFTHLSHPMHLAWYNELRRVTRPGGIMLFTTHGDNFKVKLTDEELVKYSEGKLVERSKAKEGHRIYIAFHPESYMKELFRKDSILEHIVGVPEKGKWLPQDIWIVRKEG